MPLCGNFNWIQTKSEGKIRIIAIEIHEWSILEINEIERIELRLLLYWTSKLMCLREFRFNDISVANPMSMIDEEKRKEMKKQKKHTHSNRLPHIWIRSLIETWWTAMNERKISEKKSLFCIQNMFTYYFYYYYFRYVFIRCSTCFSIRDRIS